MLGGIRQAKAACAKSGHAVAGHFAEMRNMVGIGSGAQREVEDWMLSRYACYLVVQNADPFTPTSHQSEATNRQLF